MKNLTLKKTTITIVVIWIVIQIIYLIIYWNNPAYCDARGYERRALQCYNNGSFYPMLNQLNGIVQPGYINYLILHYNLFGSTLFVPVFNILFNIIIIIELFFITRSIFNTKTGYISVILYCLLPSNVRLIIPHISEMPFLVVLLGGICFINKKKYLLTFICGFLLSVANWIRPVAFIFFITCILYFIVNRFNYKHYIALVFSYFLVIALIGFSTQHRTGYFNSKASTGGGNLLMGANDNIKNGNFGASVFEKGNIGYIENKDQLTFRETDSIYMKRSIEWIKKHPVEYIAYMPVKAARLWWGDDYLDIFIKGGKPFFDSNPTNKDFIHRIVKGVTFSITYYFILICFIFSIIKYRRHFTKAQWVVLLPVILGTGLHCIILGAQRYHYPYMPIIIIFAAYGINEYFKTVTSGKNQGSSSSAIADL